MQQCVLIELEHMNPGFWNLNPGVRALCFSGVKWSGHRQILKKFHEQHQAKSNRIAVKPWAPHLLGTTRPPRDPASAIYGSTDQQFRHRPSLAIVWENSCRSVTWLRRNIFFSPSEARPSNTFRVGSGTKQTALARQYTFIATTRQLHHLFQSFEILSA